MKLPTIPGVVVTYPMKVATYSAPTPKTWFGRTWYRVKRARWERERAQLREWRRSALRGVACAVCGVTVDPNTCFVQWSEDPSTHERTDITVLCRNHKLHDLPGF